MEIMREEVRKLEESLRENGLKWDKPVLTVDTLGTPAFPHLRITPRLRQCKGKKNPSR
jgi:adenine deaminase